MKNITVDDEIGNEIIEMYRKRKEKMIEESKKKRFKTKRKIL